MPEFLEWRERSGWNPLEAVVGEVEEGQVLRQAVEGVVGDDPQVAAPQLLGPNSI